MIWTIWTWNKNQKPDNPLKISCNYSCQAPVPKYHCDCPACLPKCWGFARLACARQKSVREGSTSNVAIDSNETLSWPSPFSVSPTISLMLPMYSANVHLPESNIHIHALPPRDACRVYGFGFKAVIHHSVFHVAPLPGGPAPCHGHVVTKGLVKACALPPARSCQADRLGGQTQISKAKRGRAKQGRTR